MLRLIISLLPFFLVGACSAEEARIVGVATAYDGDGIYVLRGGRDRLKIRLWGIDAPELGTEEGERSFHALQRVNGEVVECRPPPKQSRYPRSHDRLVARCLLSNGQDLARLQIQTGHAREWIKFSKGFYSTE